MMKMMKKICKYVAVPMVLVILAASCALAAPQGMNNQPGNNTGPRIELPLERSQNNAQPNGWRQNDGQPNSGPRDNGQPGRDQARVQPQPQRDMHQAPAPGRNGQSQPEPRRDNGRDDGDTAKSVGLVAVGAIIGSILTNTAAGR